MDFKIPKFKQFEISETDQAAEPQRISNEPQTIQDAAPSVADSVQSFDQNFFEQSLSSANSELLSTSFSFSDFGFEFDFGLPTYFDLPTLAGAGPSPDGYPGEEWLWEKSPSSFEKTSERRLTPEDFQVDESGNFIIKKS